MRAIAAAALESVRGGPAALEDVHFQAEIDDLLAEVTVEQRYRNRTDANIEAVYTFPLPLEAVLLSFEIESGDRRLAGRIVERSAAEKTYEEAITDGDAAILLEQAERGLFTASVGNLLPGGSATLRFRYGLLLRWNGDRVRFMLPTTIAPRYGDPADMPPHQVPEHALDAERPFGLELRIRGLLAGARFFSPSHGVNVTRTPELTTIKLDGAAPMDRDFVLEAQSDAARPAGAFASRDLDGWVVLASFRPEVSAAEPREPRCIKIVVDCSGSMGGDSIAQARLALTQILEGLRPGDLFDIVAFGSHHQALFGRETPVSDANVALARRFARSLDATMGGTEMGRALQAAYAIKGAGELCRDLLLITDGEVWGSERIIADARASGHRIFSVGVGSAVNEALVRGLAEATGGACELIAPREDMAQRIHRHFQRMYAPRARRAQIMWPGAPARQLPEVIDMVFDGDTVHVFGWFADRPFGQVDLVVTLPDGRMIAQGAAVQAVDERVAADAPAASTLARLAAARRLAVAHDENLTPLALRYQLLSPWTSCVVVDARPDDQKAEDLPTTIKVRQVVAAGWHGLGSVHSDEELEEFFEVAAGWHGLGSVHALRSSVEPLYQFAAPDADDLFAKRGRPAAFRRLLPSGSQEVSQADGEHWLDALIAHLNDWDFATVPDLIELEGWSLPGEITEALWKLVDAGNDEEAVVISFLSHLVSIRALRSLDRRIRRLITWRAKRLGTSIPMPPEVTLAADRLPTNS